MGSPRLLGRPQGDLGSHDLGATCSLAFLAQDGSSPLAFRAGTSGATCMVPTSRPHPLGAAKQASMPSCEQMNRSARPTLSWPWGTQGRGGPVW